MHTQIFKQSVIEGFLMQLHKPYNINNWHHIKLLSLVCFNLTQDGKYLKSFNTWRANSGSTIQRTQPSLSKLVMLVACTQLYQYPKWNSITVSQLCAPLSNGLQTSIIRSDVWHISPLWEYTQLTNIATQPEVLNYPGLFKFSPTTTYWSSKTQASARIDLEVK